LSAVAKIAVPGDAGDQLGPPAALAQQGLRQADAQIAEAAPRRIDFV
jgi:hypothetical protein